jgi:malonyl-CoA O-methyltransferase
MKIQQSFSQNAYAYDQVNIIQKKVLDKLLEKIDQKPSSLLDIGCGSGGLYKAVDWELKCFVGIDFAQGMLDLHPKGEHVTLLLKDFNDAASFDALASYTFDRVVSSSALQWAKDLDATLSRIAALDTPVSFSIFTSNTFKTLYETAGLPPMLRSREVVIELLEKHFEGEIEVVNYTLSFKSVREMFRYMKRSGVGAGRNLLGYKEMKMIMETYPLDHLEYEIVLFHQDRANL